jgi:voltage-gated potassium channel Kch
MLYALFCIRPVRILRSLRVYVKVMGIKDPVDRYATLMGIVAGVVILTFTGIMQILETHAQPLPFHTWIYYTSVTVATVGYGDITPKTQAGRLLTMTVILSAVVAVPMATNQLLEKMKLQSVYMRAFYTPKSRNAKHIVICGDLSSTSMEDLFAELFHEDHENNDLNAVILIPKPPSIELILLMQSKRYFLSITYLEGSALSDNDLRRAKAETATAIFILSNKFALSPDEEDSKSILINLSIKRYISSFHRPKMFYCLQLLRPENKRHLTKSQTGDIDDHDLVVCLNEIKMGIMAQAVVCPGANTLLMNLLTSFSDDAIELDEDEMDVEEIDMEEGETNNNNNGPSSSNTRTASGKARSPNNSILAFPSPNSSNPSVLTTQKAWFDEYQKGCGWEIYITRLAREFSGVKFSELSFALYERKGIVLFGLQLFDRKSSGASRLVLNPGEYVIPSQEDYEIDGFVIAKNKAQSDLSFETMPEENVFKTVTGNITGNISNIASTIVNSSSITERRKSTLKDVNKLRTTLAITKLGKLDDEESDSDDENNKTRAEKQAPAKESKWKKLKRSALLDRKVKFDSFQEVILRLEDEHFNQNYYVRSSPLLDINKAIIKTTVFQEVPAINHHTIVIGKSLKNLFDLIRPLRAKYLGPMKEIVLLYPTDLPADVWRRISIFEGIYIVRGSPLEDIHLRRAGIFRADTVVVLTEGISAQEKRDINDSYLVDSDAIFSYQHVKRLNPQTQIVVEIVNQSNINYLGDPNNPPLVDDPKFSPQFASGSLFMTGLLDSIVCQVNKTRIHLLSFAYFVFQRLIIILRLSKL